MGICAALEISFEKNGLMRIKEIPPKSPISDKFLIGKLKPQKITKEVSA